jgi:small subunit ribosomal protein S20
VFIKQLVLSCFIGCFHVFYLFCRITVANIKSAIKRIQISERNRLRNKSYKTAVKTLTKKYFEAVRQYAAEPTPEQMVVVEERMSSAYSKIDKAVKRGVLHTNNGARKKARLARVLKSSTQETAAA